MITIKNTGDAGRSLSGWKARDKAGHVYGCSSFALDAGLTSCADPSNGAATADSCSYNNPSASSKAC